ncbi:peptidoglycan DD-metalloendopeptidase family protein [Marinobacter orientalis]|uniref:Peptidoglycan DD-metalloendopeptidase family protein n=1 Tax=Marinobacter orientalis TaxID=1928859 RepID=A0A7Y0RBU7_9GAMM|nr:peptidoglycan DD-metalloendopeptidase family protein [Marinobacter orientalis]NMT63349.1 peptidoglycan DD-metalloendopeptidase family protein [Marinobacter orientalis]TGX51991.1 peptidase M23 [Marinobacter orientalis]
MLKMFPKTHITIAAATTIVVAAAILMSPSANVEANRMAYALDLDEGTVSKSGNRGSASVEQAGDLKKPTPDSPVVTVIKEPEPPKALDTATAAAEASEPELQWQEYRIKSGDTLSSLFSKAGFNDGVMLSVIHGDGEADKLQRLYAGERISFATDDTGELAAVDLQRNLLETLRVEKTEDGFKGETVVREPDVKPAFASGIIDGSLYVAAREAGLSDRLSMEMAGIFGWNIDFVYDVRKGDRFEVVYEELYLDGEKFDTGNILSARFVNQGKEVIALQYTDSNGDTDYYSPDGSSMRKAFLRTPINARVSSSFNLQRRHPVLDVVRPHEGTDYAAPPGTPIKAAGHGRVQFAGWKGGYGRTVILKHGDNITTLYAHMSRLGKGIKNGTRVKQGDTIGHVGSSGMVTGPHLHYEFRVNGSPRNSRTVKLPDAKPVPKSEMARFKSAADQQVARFELFRQDYQQLALAADE